MQPHELYKIEDGKVTRLRELCPSNNCPGRGSSFMGEHKDRFVCGTCGHTISKEEAKAKAAKKSGRKTKRAAKKE